MFFPAFFCAYMTAAISKLMSVVGKTFQSQTQLTSSQHPDVSHIARHALLSYVIPLSACNTSLHVAFLPVSFHFPPYFLWDPSHLQTPSVCGLLPWGESTLPETIEGRRESSAQSTEQQPRQGPADRGWRSRCRLQWLWLEGMHIYFCMFNY